MYSHICQFLLLVVFLGHSGAFLDGGRILHDFEADHLDEKLNYYEVIKTRRLPVKRQVNDDYDLDHNKPERVAFRAFSHTFDLYLFPKNGILHPKFLCHEVHSDGSERPCFVNPNEHYNGYDRSSPNSVVSLTIDEDGSMLGIVRTDGETYAFEPARNHLADADSSQTLAYRSSDMKFRKMFNESVFCASPPTYSNNTSEKELSMRRVKRSNKPVRKNRCSLRVVADHRFHKAIGNGSLSFSARYLINVIDRVNVVYTTTDWGVDEDGYRLINMGFMIKDMIIHTTPTVNQPDHYNAHSRTKRDVEKVLKNFSQLQGSDAYCLVHLFTAESFEHGVLGLGHIASPEINTAGGICSVQIGSISHVRSQGQEKALRDFIYYNTALSSAKATHGGTVISREADIVTAHELGHNWGAMHDDATEECSPSYHKGGAYIMHTYSVSGYDDNNNKFSNCSVRLIGKVLSRKSGICFEPEMSSFCGNGRVENDTDGFVEECDEGSLLHGAADSCCTTSCRFKPGAVCSPKNSPCCSKDCQFLPATSVCLHENLLQCKLSSHCTGVSGECPEPRPVGDGISCLDDGECLNGHCLSFCEKPMINKKPCICRNEADTCLRCCRSDNGTCEPYSRSVKYILRDGTRCIHGYCMNAVCIKEAADVVSHLWSIIEGIDETNIWDFIDDNLVGIIMTVVLFFWIPISILIHKLDKDRIIEVEEIKKSSDEKIETVCFRNIDRYNNVATNGVQRYGDNGTWI